IVALERSGLTAPLPSFVDSHLAFADPVVRERLAPAQATSPDLSLRSADQPRRRRPNADIWYLRFPTRGDEWCKARATTAQVIKRLRDRKIPRDVQVAHHIDGTYRPLSHYAVFRRAVRRLRTDKRLSASSTLIGPDAALVVQRTFME